jgi:hypothetical protein
LLSRGTEPLETLKAIGLIIDHAMDLLTKLESRPELEGEIFTSPMARLAQAQRMVREVIVGMSPAIVRNKTIDEIADFIDGLSDMAHRSHMIGSTIRKMKDA